MSYGELLSKVPEDLKKEIRKYEAICKKITDAKWSLEFNRTYIYIYIYIYVYTVYVYVCIYT